MTLLTTLFTCLTVASAILCILRLCRGEQCDALCLAITSIASGLVVDWSYHSTPYSPIRYLMIAVAGMIYAIALFCDYCHYFGWLESPTPPQCCGGKCHTPVDLCEPMEVLDAPPTIDQRSEVPFQHFPPLFVQSDAEDHGSPNHD
jgi:hypothetical protein